MEWSIPYGIHCYSTWIPLDSIWNLGISTMDSMDKSIWIPWTSPYGLHGTSQYLSLPHVFLLDSRTPVGFLPESYWISTKFPKRHFHIFFQSLPTGLLLDSHWTPTELKQCECNASKIGFLLDSYWTPTGVSCKLLLLTFHILDNFV